MDKSDEHRSFPSACLELAHVLNSVQERAILLQMAVIWSRLAERVVEKESNESSFSANRSRGLARGNHENSLKNAVDRVFQWPQRFAVRFLRISERSRAVSVPENSNRLSASTEARQTADRLRSSLALIDANEIAATKQQNM
jgi:hypothetical protein